MTGYSSTASVEEVSEMAVVRSSAVEHLQPCQYFIRGNTVVFQIIKIINIYYWLIVNVLLSRIGDAAIHIGSRHVMSRTRPRRASNSENLVTTLMLTKLTTMM